VEKCQPSCLATRSSGRPGVNIRSNMALNCVEKFTVPRFCCTFRPPPWHIWVFGSKRRAPDLPLSAPKGSFLVFAGKSPFARLRATTTPNCPQSYSLREGLLTEQIMRTCVLLYQAANTSYRLAVIRESSDRFRQSTLPFFQGRFTIHIDGFWMVCGRRRWNKLV
jgi:hypothetical protein